MADYLIEQKITVLYYLHYCNGTCLNLYLKIVQKTSHKLEIHIYSRIFENWVNFSGQNIQTFQDICNIAKNIKEKNKKKYKTILLLKLDNKYDRYIL